MQCTELNEIVLKTVRHRRFREGICLQREVSLSQVAETLL